MNFNKKQMQPLIDKYQINPETNKLFINICEMFNEQPNYQIWAVKMIFSKAMDFETLERIHEWVEKNQGAVKLLEKQNIVSYSSAMAIRQLLSEMEGLKKIVLLKNVISCFNTDQRKILTNAIFTKQYTPLEANTNKDIKNWYTLFEKFSKLPMARRNNVYIMCSSIRDIIGIETQIRNAIEEKYEWNKEDMLAFMENNTKGCEVVFNEGPYVILLVTNYDASKKLCGGGRTQWCLTKNESYFKDYAGGNSRDQYFYFDFSRKETDCFAHIGFTIEKGNGVLYAQTCDNHDMRNGYRQGGEVKTFADIMNNAGVKMSLFMRLRGKFPFGWNIVSVIEAAKKNKDLFSIVFDDKNKLIVEIANTKGLSNFINHTFISAMNCPLNDSHKLFILLDFDKNENEEKSLVAMSYRKDQYGSLSLERITDIFGQDITKSGYLNSIGLSTEDFIKSNGIDPKILLHKYIDEGDEIAAIKLIQKEGKNFDVNYMFNQRVPIFAATHSKMYKLFDTIINHPKWDSTQVDGFGETLLQSLIYLYGCDEITCTKEEEVNLEKLLKLLVKSGYVDFNALNLNGDTAISIACEFPKLAWLVSELASKKKVNVNTVNDFDATALTNCIRNKNLGALKAIGMRPDLIVREADKKAAKAADIKLESFIKPSASIFEAEKSESLEEVMAEAL